MKKNVDIEEMIAKNEAVLNKHQDSLGDELKPSERVREICASAINTLCAEKAAYNERKRQTVMSMELHVGEIFHEEARSATKLLSGDDAVLRKQGIVASLKSKYRKILLEELISRNEYFVTKESALSILGDSKNYRPPRQTNAVTELSIDGSTSYEGFRQAAAVPVALAKESHLMSNIYPQGLRSTQLSLNDVAHREHRYALLRQLSAHPEQRSATSSPLGAARANSRFGQPNCLRSTQLSLNDVAHREHRYALLRQLSAHPEQRSATSSPLGAARANSRFGQPNCTVIYLAMLR